MQLAAADPQHCGASLEMNVSSLVQTLDEVADPDDFPDAALMSTAISSSARDRRCHCAAKCRSATVKQEADLMVAKIGVNSASAALRSVERCAGVSP